MKNSRISGGCAGAATGATATTTIVPVVQALGFNPSGIAANSAAAGMMSSAAIGAGGGVASGSTVAVLQGIGSTAAVPLGIAAATVAVPAAIGVGVGAIFSGLHKDKLDSTSAYEQRGTEGNCWVVAIEKGPGNVRVLRYSNESDARKRFRESWSIRILYSPDGKEVAAGGWNRWAHATIRRVMKNEYFSV